MGLRFDDIAHISIRLDQKRVTSLLVEHVVAQGYARVPLKSGVHLLKVVNWESPLDPLPEFRCFMVLPTENGWTNVTDELNVFDRALAEALSASASVITVRGSSRSELFEFDVIVDGTSVDQELLDPSIASTLAFLTENGDHVTRFSYDELGSSVPTATFERTEFVGFKLRRS